MFRRSAPFLSLLLVVSAITLLSANGAFGGAERSAAEAVPATRPTIVISLLEGPPASGDAASTEEGQTPEATDTASSEAPADGEVPEEGGQDDTASSPEQNELGSPSGEADQPGGQAAASSASALTSPEDADVGEASAASGEAGGGELGGGGANDDAPGAGEAGDATAVAGGSGESHVVAEGETPWSIAQRYRVSVEELLAANGIDDPTGLQIGTELRIP